MGTKPRHRCVTCHESNIAMRYKRVRRKHGQRRYSWFCFECEAPFLLIYTPNYISCKQKRHWMEVKHGYKIQTKEEVMCNVQTLENGLDGQEKASRASLV